MKIPTKCPVCNDDLNTSIIDGNVKAYSCYKMCFNDEIYHFNLEVTKIKIYHISRGLPNTNGLFLSFEDGNIIRIMEHDRSKPRKLLFQFQIKNIDDYIDFYLQSHDKIIQKIRKLGSLS